MALFDEQTKALWEVGFVRPIDLMYAAVMAMCAVTAMFWCIFGNPTVIALLTTAVSMLVMFQLWLILLLYRCLYFIIQTRADINLMPEQAAKLALLYQAGGHQAR